MPRRRLVLGTAALLVLAACLAPGRGVQAPAGKLEVVCDRADALYRCGDEALFSVRAQRGDTPLDGSVSWTLTYDGGVELGHGRTTLDGGQTSISGSLDRPGVLRCQVTLDGATPLSARGAAAFEPEKIAPAAAEPADFDAFWTAQKALLDDIPIDAQLAERPEHSNDAVQVFSVSLANIDGSRVRGWLGVPRRPGPKPAVLTVPWAGVYATSVGLIGWASQGCLAMAISAHDAEIDQPEEYYRQLDQGRLRGYPSQGRESRETYYFRRVFLGCVRAVEYMTGRDDWDRKTMIVTGSSQGGGLSIITAGLDPRVTGIAANVPALCDHLGADAGRQPGWPQIVPAGDEAVRATAGCYDAVNFARRVHCPAVVGVGLIDTTCPPSGVFAAYNQLAGPKQIDIAPRMGHAQNDSYTALANRFVREQAGLPAP